MEMLFNVYKRSNDNCDSAFVVANNLTYDQAMETYNTTDYIIVPAIYNYYDTISQGDLNMQIIPLGVGGAFTKKFYHNNYLLDFGDEKVVIDMGTSFMSHGDYKGSLENAGYKLTDVTGIIITHLHSDHVGGLGSYAQEARWVYQHKPTLITTEALAPKLMNQITEDLTARSGEFKITDYFDIALVPESFDPNEMGSVQIPGTPYSIYFLKTHHMHMKDMLSYGLVIVDTSTQARIIFSGDIRDLAPSLLKEVCNKDTKAILQDVQFFSKDEGMPHAHFDEIVEYYPNEFHHMIYLMHYPDNIEQYIDTIKHHGMNIVQQGVPISLI